MKNFIFPSLLLSNFFGVFLGSRLLNVPDEGRYAEVSREMVSSGDYVTPRINDIVFLHKPPLSYWLQAAAIKTFGLKGAALTSSIIRCVRLLINLRCDAAILKCGLVSSWIARHYPLIFCISALH